MTSPIRVSHGLHRPSYLVDDLPGRVASLLTVCPDDTVVAGLTAARLHGLWLPPWADGPVETIVHRSVERPARRPRSRRSELRTRRQLLHPDETVELAGLPVTSGARTWRDLAARLELPDLIALGDCVLRGGTSSAELVSTVARGAHRPGIVRARAALPLLDGRSRSRPESHLRYALHVAGLPKPEVNVAIYSALGEWLCEPDLSYSDVLLALEYNGADHADRPRMRKDITRTVDVEERGGWRVVTFGPSEVFARPDLVGGWVRRLRRERGARP